MTYTRTFSQLGQGDSGAAGGKGASLGEMTRAGIPVPPGFVILTDAFDHFLKEANLVSELEAILDTVDHAKLHTIEHASEKIQSLIRAATMPESIAEAITSQFQLLGAEYVAVRSSATAEDGATAAWAGQLDSYLNTDEAHLLENVQRCWASLFTPRAIFYRFEKGMHGSRISVAVVVQAMVQSEVSGIAFSAHPVTEDRNQLIIEAGYGLGEAIVSGQVTPDSYVVEKSPRRIIDTHIATQARALYRREGGGNEWHAVPEPKASAQVLAEKEILELSELILKIEDHYGSPCDIEWAFARPEQGQGEKACFYITQSRPITTLGNDQSQTASELLEELKRFSFEPATRFSKVPVIVFEPAVTGSYLGNPFVDMYADNPSVSVATIAFLSESYESWRDVSTIPHITKRANIKHVLERCRGLVHTHRSRTFPQIGTTDSSADELITELHEYVRSLHETYQLFTFFTDESFETDDPVLAGMLAEMRWKLSEHVVSPVWMRLETLLDVVHHRTGIARGILDLVSVAELEHIISTGEVSSAVLLSVQGEMRAFVCISGTCHLLDSDESHAVREFITSQAPLQNSARRSANAQELKGKVAYKGIARGRVKIVSEHEYTQLANLHLEHEDAYVLVTPMTRPEIVPYIQHALAIVTDEGGITCHAAIISRELKVPCVIGTKIATRILADGDEVEVDADNGVVRILHARR